MSAVAMLLRRLKSEAGILVLLFLLVTFTSFLFAAAPRLFNRVTDDAVRYAVATSNPVDRDVWLYANGTISPGTDGGAGAIHAYGTARQGEFPASINGLFSEGVGALTTVRLTVPNSIVVLSLRYQEGLTDAATLVDGRWPVDVGMPLKQVGFGKEPSPDDVANPAVFEAALSQAEADAIGAHIGDKFDVGLDNSDPLLPKNAFSIAPTQVEIVGLFEPNDPTSDEWSGSGLLQPTLQQGPDGVSGIQATVYVPAEAYPNLAAARLPFHYDWHFQVDPSRLNADVVSQLQLDLQRLNLVVAPTDQRYLRDQSSNVTVNDVSVGTGLIKIIDAFATQRARSESVLSIAALGLLGLAGGATAMVAILLVRRRRSGLLLARGRGASGRLLLAAQLVEAVLICGTAALLGYAIALVAVPARDDALSPVLSLIVALATTLLLVGATWPAARRPLVQLERDDPPVIRVPARRLVFETSIVVIALGAVVLLRQRGLTLGSSGDSVSFDPLLAAVPLLAGMAAGIVALRLYPLPVRGLGELAARRRDFVPVAGLRTVARHPATANLPLLVLMLTAAFGAFASVVQSSVDRGQTVASYREVGADYRLEEVGLGGLHPATDPATMPGVQASATAYVDRSAGLMYGQNQRATIDFTAVDTDAYTNVTAGTAAAPIWPSSFFATTSAVGTGTSANPIPAILSTQVPPAMAGIGIGDTFTVGIAQQQLSFRVVGRQDDFPGHGNAATFVIVPLNWFTAAVPDRQFVPNLMWLRASAATAAPLAALADDPADRVRVVSRLAAYGLLHDAPLGSAVADFFGVALIVAVLFMAITLVGAVIMSASGRTRDLAYLRTLGVSGRQAQALTAVEQLPPVLLALIPGILLGIAVAILVEPGLGLADFVGAQGVPLSIDWLRMLLVVIALSLVVAIAIAAGTWLAGRARLASALRIEES